MQKTGSHTKEKKKKREIEEIITQTNKLKFINFM